ncbi:class I adenylate-forming enzyme family protein [Nocardia aurantia]|uniref:Long-chain-fatty-acid--CoA ligase n=1 Tax=Nocardia aurantia TaxID=2585199 RepID=A0A7K0DLY3_9NOCA|nr:AMP-binding protein [Nocardia aurantia]MQY25824.1 Long-chain-fatty-acid--CoA ligase [Nocardia aurantia]
MSNTATAIWEHADHDPDRIALRGDDGTGWTYAQLRGHVAAVTTQLTADGIGPGDRVLFVAPSVPEFAAGYYGIHAAGAIAVTANTMSPAPELEYIARDTGVSAVLGWHAVAPAPERVAAALGVPYRALHPDLAGLPPAAGPIRPHPTADDDTATIIYTSGTTGRPKGAQLSHGNFLACADAFRTVFDITADDRSGTALPLFHVYGQACVLGTAMRSGGSLSLLSRFDPERMLAMIGRDRLTFITGVPTMWNAMLHAAAADIDPADFASLRQASSGGASLPGEVLEAFRNRFGCAISEGYGLTETTSAATYQPADRPAKAGSVGRPLPGIEIVIRDFDGAELPPGETGEIFIRGPVVTKGYWNRPEATAEALHEGWLRTGDLGVFDADGDLRIAGRVKEMIIRGGYNVYPLEVEEVLYRHPDIVEATVVGVPDEHYGEEVAAALTLRPGADFDPIALREWTKQQLSAYKVPRLFAVLDELPKGPSGKILKNALDSAIFADVARRD